MKDPWAEIEKQLLSSKEQPEGSMTSEQYAASRKPPISLGESQKRLVKLYRAKLVRRERWGPAYVYWPVKK